MQFYEDVGWKIYTKYVNAAMLVMWMLQSVVFMDEIVCGCTACKAIMLYLSDDTPKIAVQKISNYTLQ